MRHFTVLEVVSEFNSVNWAVRQLAAGLEILRNLFLSNLTAIRCETAEESKIVWIVSDY